MRHTAFALAAVCMWCAKHCVYMDKVVVALVGAVLCGMVWGVLELAAAIKSNNGGK